MTLIGHNSGASPLAKFDDKAVLEHEEALVAIKVSADKWEKTKVTEKNAPQLKEAIQDARNAYNKTEDARKREKEPFLTEGKRVDAAFGGILRDIEDYGKKLKAVMKAHLDREEEKERLRRIEEQRKAEEEARKKREEAERAAAEVEAKNRKMRAEEAARIIEKKRAAEKLEAAAAKAAKKADALAKVRVTGGVGKAMSVRTRMKATIEDYETAFLEFCEEEEIRDLLVKLANRRANAAGFDREAGIPGFTLEEVRSI